MTKLWEPSPQRVAQANLTAFAAAIAAKHGVDVGTYKKLWQWSIDHKQEFWREMWNYGGVLGTPGDRVLLDADRMPGARWFPDAKLNFAQNLLERRRADDDGDALVFWGEDKVRRVVSHASLHALASRVSSALAACGIVAGDRVAAYMPNMPETIIAMLGTASVGAIWSSCSPDFGVNGVLDRLGTDRAARPVHRRRLLVQRQGHFDSRQGGADRRQAAFGRAGRRRSVSATESGNRGRRLRHPRCLGMGRVARAVHRRADRLSGAAVRPSAVHPVLVGNDGCAEMHRARRRRHAVATPEGTPAARRPQVRRPPVLLHDLRLDDVELAGLRAGGAARRCCSTTARRSSTADASCGSSPMPRR